MRAERQWGIRRRDRFGGVQVVEQHPHTDDKRCRHSAEEALPVQTGRGVHHQWESGIFHFMEHHQAYHAQEDTCENLRNSEEIS